MSSVSIDSYLRLPQVLSLIPVSRASWYRYVKAGVFPAPVKLGLRTAAWRQRDIEQLAASFDKKLLFGQKNVGGAA